MKLSGTNSPKLEGQYMNTVRTEKCSSRRIQTCIKTAISTSRVKFPFKITFGLMTMAIFISVIKIHIIESKQYLHYDTK